MQLDEKWSFVGKKQKRCDPDGEAGWFRGDRWDHVVATKDWHIDPGNHFSDHPDYLDTWPAHCVVGSSGADFHPALVTDRVEEVFHKGEHKAAYSGFERKRGRPGEEGDGTVVSVVSRFPMVRSSWERTSTTPEKG